MMSPNAWRWCPPLPSMSSVFYSFKMVQYWSHGESFGQGKPNMAVVPTLTLYSC